MTDCYCRPRVLADFYTNATTADNALGQVAADLENAYHRFFAACSDFVPALGVPYRDLRKLQTDNLSVNGFALDVANAFIAAGGGHIDINTIGPEVELRGDSAAIEARVPEVSADRVRAEQDRQAIEHALDVDDDDALRDALGVALEHSGNGENEAYAATLVILLGKDDIDRVLDRVGYVSEMYAPRQLDEEDITTIAVPMAVILQSATRSGNPQALEIANGYLTEARRLEPRSAMYAGYLFDPPEPRRRLGLLLTAGVGDANWVAEAADVMLLGDGARNSRETVYFNEVALRALGANDEASYIYLTSDELTSTQDERLTEMLNAGTQLSGGPAFYGEVTEPGAEFNVLAGAVLESGLVQYPERFGDPLTTPAVADEAAQAAEVYADIVNIVGNDADGSPFGGTYDEGDDPLRNSLARIGSSTWMMDRMALDAGNAERPGSPDLIASVEVLDDFYTELIGSDDARRALELGSVAYVNSSMTEVVATMNPELVLAALGEHGEVPIPSEVRRAFDGPAAQVTALARAINGEEITAADAQNASASWFGALAEGVTGAVGVGPLSVPSALLAPLTSTGVSSWLEAPAETAGAGGTLVVDTTHQTEAALHAILQRDPRFSHLPLADRQVIVDELSTEFRFSLGFQLGVGDYLEPRP
ncbi:MAG: hypothetical protein ACRD0U_01760 [Acidimicrobiales bacterium]